MKKYFVSIPWNCSVFCEVEAENKEQAIEKAFLEISPSLCRQCSDEIELDEFNDNIEISVEEIK